jgi:hypothetical protein
MQRFLLAVLFAIGCCSAWSIGADHEAGKKDGHVVLTPDQLQWGPNPALPPGAMASVLSGDPTKPGSVYAVRVKMGDGYKVPPHWHPTDENVTVLQGSLMIGTGDKFDAAKMEAISTGGFMRMPKGMNHFAMAKGDTIIQIHGVGPFDIHYLNPADDPRKK